MYSYELAQYEEVLSVMSMKVGNEVFYVCGTAYVLENESEPKQGRILLFKYDQDNSLFRYCVFIMYDGFKINICLNLTCLNGHFGYVISQNIFYKNYI